MEAAKEMNTGLGARPAYGTGRVSGEETTGGEELRKQRSLSRGSEEVSNL